MEQDKREKNEETYISIIIVIWAHRVISLQGQSHTHTNKHIHNRKLLNEGVQTHNQKQKETTGFARRLGIMGIPLERNPETLMVVCVRQISQSSLGHYPSQ